MKSKEEDSKAKNNLSSKEDLFEGYAGAKCSRGDILVAANAINNLDGQDKNTIAAQIFNGLRNDIKWGCAPEHITGSFKATKSVPVKAPSPTTAKPNTNPSHTTSSSTHVIAKKLASNPVKNSVPPKQPTAKASDNATHTASAKKTSTNTTPPTSNAPHTSAKTMPTEHDTPSSKPKATRAKQASAKTAAPSHKTTPAPAKKATNKKTRPNSKPVQVKREAKRKEDSHNNTNARNHQETAKNAGLAVAKRNEAIRANRDKVHRAADVKKSQSGIKVSVGGSVNLAYGGNSLKKVGKAMEADVRQVRDDSKKLGKKLEKTGKKAGRSIGLFHHKSNKEAEISYLYAQMTALMSMDII